MIENRKFKRFGQKLLVRIHSGEALSCGIMSDVSQNGMFIRSEGVFQENTIVSIELVLPDNRVSSLKGRVKRKKKIPGSNWLFGTGIELMEKDSAFRAFLQSISGQAGMEFTPPHLGGGIS